MEFLRKCGEVEIATSGSDTQVPSREIALTLIGDLKELSYKPEHLHLFGDRYFEILDALPEWLDGNGSLHSDLGPEQREDARLMVVRHPQAEPLPDEFDPILDRLSKCLFPEKSGY